uniref:helix-turn-helix domain-containing protein n=1 Tax=Candidatus Fimivicinus sp. TaxID=3056640 RepID=UPI004026B573
MDKKEASFDKQVYSIEDIQQMLGIGRSKIYSFIEEVNKKQEPFKVIRIGRIYRIPKGPFDKWINGD